MKTKENQKRRTRSREPMNGGFRVPLATYRLQFNRDFTFEQAAEITDYLRDLGISDCYASPVFRARAQSAHGYDVCSFEEINPELGGVTGLNHFAGRLRELGMGLLVDMVPNHMAADACNPWWRDVLKQGTTSRYASWFDIDWHRPNPELREKILLPVLEDDYRNVLESGKLKLVLEPWGPAIAYYDRRFPVSGAPVSSAGHTTHKLAPTSKHLEQVLQQQHYHLACWRLAPEKINYRRFFDITELVSVRVELPEVFAATHALLLRLIKDGLITGLRIDHPDGLWDPQQYCERLQAACRNAKPPGANAVASASGSQPFYVVVEKILTGDEQLPAGWPVAGTTGYDFLFQVNGLFVNAANGPALDKAYERLCNTPAKPFKEIVCESKKLVLRKSFAGELTALARRLRSLADTFEPDRKFSLEQLRDALVEVVIAFPVYRTYIGEETSRPGKRDREHINRAIAGAKAAAASADSGTFDFIQNLLLLRPGHEVDKPELRRIREFVMRFQQLTAPAMAKGLEDTAFYNYDRLVSLNEVGGDPGRFGAGLDAFHGYNVRKATQLPHSLLATATHDTKRGEDVRARINVLSELPDEWERAVLRWRALNADKKSTVDGELAPDANDEYLFYQTLVGTWPVEPVERKSLLNRIAAFMLKAIKEAKARTSWTDPNVAYEKATQSFVERTLTMAEPNVFVDEFLPFQRRVAFFGQFNSFSQTLIKITAPGVPDFYQGTELWDFSLVDPDNRRPVDFNLRCMMLDQLKRAWNNNAPNVPFAMDADAGFDFRPETKLFLIWRALECRRRHHELFERGSYEPLSAEGPQQEHVCAFARILDRKAIVTVAPRLMVGLTSGVERSPLGSGVWQSTALALPSVLAGRELRNAVTGESLRCDHENRVRMAEVFRSFPVAILGPVERQR